MDNEKKWYYQTNNHKDFDPGVFIIKWNTNFFVVDLINRDVKNYGKEPPIILECPLDKIRDLFSNTDFFQQHTVIFPYKFSEYLVVEKGEFDEFFSKFNFLKKVTCGNTGDL